MKYFLQAIPSVVFQPVILSQQIKRAVPSSSCQWFERAIDNHSGAIDNHSAVTVVTQWCLSGYRGNFHRGVLCPSEENGSRDGKGESPLQPPSAAMSPKPRSLPDRKLTCKQSWKHKNPSLVGILGLPSYILFASRP